MQNNASDPLFSELDSHPVRCEPVHITLNEDAQPYSLSTARRVPIPLMSKVKEELSRLQKAGVIEVISEPTDWSAPIIPVLKNNGTVRICNDYKQLNKVVKRERHVLPTLEDILHKLSGAKVFSRLDATSGFFQLPLDDESAKLTTFITPFGHYFYRRLPQGITSSPEIFQGTVESMLCDQPHAVCFFDDILVFIDNDSDHKKHLENTKNKLGSYGLKLNPQECEFHKKELEFLGYVISGEGIRIDPGKIEAIVKMSNPENVQELRRFVGMVNFLGRHLPNLSTIMQPITQLLEKDKAWGWGPHQEDAVSKIKELLTSAPTLAFYDPVKPTIVTADASSYGIGGALLQEQKDGSTRPVAYCSRMLTRTERRYAQIEECLAAVWCCEKFDRYLIGLDQSFTLQTDHKPLVPLINSKDLSDTPIRCQRMLMRTACFNAEACYTQGKNMFVADTLSRSLIKHRPQVHIEEEVTAHVSAITSTWPASDAFLDRIRKKTEKDICLKTALEYTMTGWPEFREDVKLAARNLYAVRGELSG